MIAIVLMQAPSSEASPNNLIPAIRVQDSPASSERSTLMLVVAMS